jgi:hypothetical protein
LEGTVPQELCDKDLNSVFFMNTADGTSDGDVAGRRRILEAERDGCTSIACPVGTVSTKGNADGNGIYPCEACPTGTTNRYLGATSCVTTDQTAILKDFLTHALVMDPHFDASTFVNACDYDGIRCNAVGDVTEIVLPSAGLTGTLSPSLGYLEHLEVLDVSNNSLEGYNLPSELHFAPLETLDVSNNMLQGVVPPSLCRKSYLNGNGEGGWFSGGDFTCDAIACPVGTFGEISGSGECLPCPAGNADYLGMTTCDDGFKTSPALLLSDALGSSSKDMTSSMHYQAGATFGVLLVTFMTMCFMCAGCFMCQQRRRKLMGSIHDMHDATSSTQGAKDEEFVDPEDEVPTSFKHVDTSTAAKGKLSPNGNRGSGTFASELDQIPTNVQVTKSKNAWSSGKEKQTEVWLDVPKMLDVPKIQ